MAWLLPFMNNFGKEGKSDFFQIRVTEYNSYLEEDFQGTYDTDHAFLFKNLADDE